MCALPEMDFSWMFLVFPLLCICVGFLFHCCPVARWKLLWKCKKQLFYLNGYLRMTLLLPFILNPLCNITNGSSHSMVFSSHFCAGNANTLCYARNYTFFPHSLFSWVQLVVILSITYIHKKAEETGLKLTRTKLALRTVSEHVVDGACMECSEFLWYWILILSFMAIGCFCSLTNSLQLYVSRMISIIKIASKSYFRYPFNPELPLSNPSWAKTVSITVKRY